MAYESVGVTPGTGKDVAVDTVAGQEIQIVKLDGGGDGVSVPIEAGIGAAANGLRVALASASEIIANLSATDNAVLDAIQTAVEACRTALEATLTVSGTVDLGATDNAVLDAIQTAVEAIQTALAGTITVDGTVNLGATDNAVLDTIATNTGAALTDTELRATPVPVSGTVTANLSATDNAVLDAIQAAVEILDNAISGTEIQADIVASLPAGTNAIGKLAANSGVDIGDVDVLSIAAGDNNIGNVDIASIAAGETHIGEVGLPDDTITITCSLDTNAYADGDVLFATQEIAGAVRVNGDTCILQSVHVIDIDDQGIEMDLVFFNANTSLGTENAAPDIDDTEVLTTLGYVNVADYIDLGANKIGTVTGIGLPLKAGAATTSLWVAGITRGTPTHSASGLQIVFGFLRN